MTKSPEISFTNPSDHFKSLVWAANNNLNLTLPQNNNNNNNHYDCLKLDNLISCQLSFDTLQEPALKSSSTTMTTTFDEQSEVNNKSTEMIDNYYYETMLSLGRNKQNEALVLNAALHESKANFNSDINLNGIEKSQQLKQQVALSSDDHSSTSSISTSLSSKLSLSSSSSSSSIASHSESEHSSLMENHLDEQESFRVKSRQRVDKEKLQKRVEPMIVISTPPIEWALASVCPLPTRVRHFSAPLKANFNNQRGSQMSKMRQIQVSLVFCLLVVSAGPTLRAAFGAPATTKTTMDHQQQQQQQLNLVGQSKSSKQTDTSHWMEQKQQQQQHLLMINSEKSQQQQQQINPPSNEEIQLNQQQHLPIKTTTTTNLKRTEFSKDNLSSGSDGPIMHSIALSTQHQTTSTKSESESESKSNADLDSDQKLLAIGRHGTVRSSRIKRTGTSDQRLADYEIQLMRRDRERARAAAAIAAASASASAAAAAASAPSATTTQTSAAPQKTELAS